MLAAVGLAVVVLVLAASAAAQEPGVFVDPDSPAGIEYAVPLDKARREAVGGSPGRVPAGGRSADSQPLFGVGIDDPGGGGPGAAASSDGARPSSPDATPGATGDRRGAEGRGGSGGRGSDVGRSASPEQRSTAAVEVASSGGPEPLLTAGIAAGVLAVGLVLGLGLRRLLRDN